MVAVLFDDIQNPTAELLGNRSPGEHCQKVASAKGEKKAFYRERRIGVVGDFNYLRRVRGKFIRMGTVNFGGLIFAFKPKSFGKFNSTNPRAVMAIDRGESDFVETTGLGHDDSYRTFHGS